MDCRTSSSVKRRPRTLRADGHINIAMSPFGTGVTPMRTLERMSSTDSTDIQQMVASLLANRPYSHRQDVDEGVVAAVTLEHDMRFIEATLQAVLSQSVLPGLIIVADCTDSIGQPVQSSFEVIPSPSGLALHMPQSKRVTVQLVGVKTPRSFTDAMSQALKAAKVPSSMRCIWMLHDDSRPADEHCLETLLEAWRNAPTASLLGAKQLDWDAQALHNVGAYAAKHRIESLVVEGEPDQEQYDARRDVFSVSLAGALLPVATLRSLEGIDSWFGTFREGVDFCRRICLSGGRVVVVPKARIAHRRARFEGLRNREGKANEDGRAENSALSRMAAQQRYYYTDRKLVLWPVIWLLSVFASVAKAVWRLFNKQPYEAWCEICLPWLMWTGWTHAIRARRRVRRQSKVSLSRLSVLVVDRHQLAQWRDRRNALENQRNMVLLSPLAKAHLRVRMLRRWTAALAMAIVAGGFVIATNWEVFRSAFSDGSLYSDTLLPTGASFQQLAEAATTPWAYGSATGMPAPPLPWLLVWMIASLFTIGHINAALIALFFLAAPLSALSFWALAGIFTRSDAVRVTAGLFWASFGMALGLYAQANVAMLTVMVFLPAAFAFVFRAVGMYVTEDPVMPRASVQSAAAAALCFVAVVASEPQLLLPLIVSFVVFVIVVRRHHAMLLLIPLPAAFVLAPTILNAIRYATVGSWRQLFADAMVPDTSGNAAPASLGLGAMLMRAFGIHSVHSDADWSALGAWEWAIAAIFVVCVLASLIALVKSSMVRESRMMWVVMLCGIAVALVSARVAIAVDEEGVVAGSVIPGFALSMVGILSCVCMIAGEAVKQYKPLHDSSRQSRVWAIAVGDSVAGHMLRTVLAAVMVAGACAYGGFGLIMQPSSLHVSDERLPMVAMDYLHKDNRHRILALRADGNTIVQWTSMRTSRGDLIDSSPAQRAQFASGIQSPQQESLSASSARLLANADAEAVANISALGYGGIYVVASGDEHIDEDATQRLISNINASDGVQAVVSSDSGTYYRLTINDPNAQVIDNSGVQYASSTSWRTAWLIIMGIVVAMYCLVAVPRPSAQRYRQEEA